jgi:uncharacterized protein (TIGR00369 family)
MSGFEDHIKFMEEEVPFNKHLGFTVLECEEGYAKVLIPYRPEFIGDPRRPALHGGFMAAMIDATGGLAVWTQFETEDLISTVDMRIDYLRPGPDKDIEITSQVVRMGNRVSVVNSSACVAGCADEVLAEGRAVYNTRRKSDR